MSQLATAYRSHSPNTVLEERAFIFIDLNDSTSISEQLSPLAYSRLLSTAFGILEQISENYPFRVYQYVGDEVVLSWKPSSHPEAWNMAIQLVFEFNIALRAHHPQFYRAFKIAPVFKSSIHYGRVAKAIVGTSFPNMAYHGEVLNASAKMLTQAKQHHSALVISQPIYNRLSLAELPFRFTPIGSLGIGQSAGGLFIWQVSLSRRREKFLTKTDYQSI
ncbi:MAG: adenylate/guanylate cyclase domain-containing protein [Bacteroidota bacterium]